MSRNDPKLIDRIIAQARAFVRAIEALGYLSPDDYEQLYRSANCA